MNWTTTKPTEPGAYIYREGTQSVSVKVDYYQDLQCGIPRHLVATPTPPKWGSNPMPAWAVELIDGEWKRDIDEIKQKAADSDDATRKIAAIKTILLQEP